MSDEYDAERLAAALEGATAVDAQTRALVSMAHELAGALTGSLDATDRSRIYGNTMRLVEHDRAAAQLGRFSLDDARRAFGKVRVGRRGGAVLGGVAAASVAAAIGYAVIHERRSHRGAALA